MVKYGCGNMREEMDKNEDLVHDIQVQKVKDARGTPENTQRRYVNAWSIVLWHFCALVAVCFWLLRLLGVVDITAI